MAVSAITVSGNTSLADILVGYTQQNAPINPGAQIGSITIDGNCTATNIIAGAQNSSPVNANFGDNNDVPIPSNSTINALSAIASITINGTVSGTDSTTNAADHFGIVAQQIGALTVHGTQIHLTPGPSNDDIPLGNTGDFNVHEI